MSDSPELESIIERSQKVIEGGAGPKRSKKYKRYAVSNFRGGIGKSTLTFNLAYEVSRDYRALMLDTCSQKNLSQAFFADTVDAEDPTLNGALVDQLTGTEETDIADIVLRVTNSCPPFKGGQGVYAVPGSSELFLLPSLLYSQLAQYSQLGAQAKAAASKRALLALDRIIIAASDIAKPSKIIIDTSPFFGGATHLAWCAAEALIIPVRVDQNSVDALRLTLRMLDEQKMDFHRFNDQAALDNTPLVHAVVMTHCGWSRQRANTPDSSTKFFAQKAVDIAMEYPNLFSETDITKCFYLLDDFHSAGRISGNQRIPLAKLNAGDKYVVDGQRLEVNPSVDRYKNEVRALASAL